MIEEKIKSEGIDVLLLGGVVPNPLLSKAKEMTKEAVKFGAEFVLAVGGGSVIDTAKFVAIGVASPDTDIEEFFFKERRWKISSDRYRFDYCRSGFRDQ